MALESKNKQDKGLVLHPILFALYHVLVLYALYEERTPLSALTRPSLVIATVAVLLTTVLWAFTKNVHKAGLIATIVLMAMLTGWTCLEYVVRTVRPTIAVAPVWLQFVAYGVVSIFGVAFIYWFLKSEDQAKARRLAITICILCVLNAVIAEFAFTPLFGHGDAWFISIYLILLFIVLSVVLQKVSDYPHLTRSGNNFGMILVILAIIMIALHMPSVEKLPPHTVPNPASEQAGSPISTPPPDIYFITLNGYARADILQAMYGFDVRPFYEIMHNKGFRIARWSTANYPDTMLSLASCLNMDYLQSLIPDESKRRIATLPTVAELYHNNAVYQFLRSKGYEIVAMSPGVELLEPRQDVSALRPPRNLTEFEVALLESSAVIRVMEIAHAMGYTWAGDLQSVRERDRVHFVFEELARLASVKEERPRFIVAHLGIPSPPLLFEEDGQWNQKTIMRTYGPGESFRGSRREFVDGYDKQLLFVNRKLVETIEQIKERSSRPPMIIIVSPHGPGSLSLTGAPGEGGLVEQFANLTMLHFPEGAFVSPEIINDNLSLVNLFRGVFNAVLGTKFDAKSNATYAPKDNQPMNLAPIVVPQTVPVTAPPMPTIPAVSPATAGIPLG